MRQPLRKTVWWFLNKFNIEWPHDWVILLLGIDPKEMKIVFKQKPVYEYPYSTIHKSQQVETQLMNG